MNSESDLLLKCIKCKHQKIDHHRTAARDKENKYIKCNVIIHPAFLGHHKCGHGNCPVCKNPILNKEYWRHIRSHPGHENAVPPRKTMFQKNSTLKSINCTTILQSKMEFLYQSSVIRI